MEVVAEALHQQAEVAILPATAVVEVDAAHVQVWAHKAAWDKATVAKVGLTSETMATLAMKAVAANLSPAVIYLQLNRPCAAQASVRLVATAAAMAAGMAARRQRPHAPVANLTPCAPA
jgi:hypothetical protein